jgi:hypothetical protein
MKTGLPIIIIRWRRIEISESQIRSMPQNESGNRDRKVSINGLKTRFIAPNFPHKAIVINQVGEKWHPPTPPNSSFLRLRESKNYHAENSPSAARRLNFAIRLSEPAQSHRIH